MNWLIQKWYNKSYFCYLLIPLAIIYSAAFFLHRSLFNLGIKKTSKFSVPVIVVGNITVGGTGKTPLVIWLVKFLRTQGFRPGIVSRGYGGTASSYPQWVNHSSDPAAVSEEAILLHQKTACPMVIAPNRPLAIATLLDNTDCNVIISDDGLQHYAMGRDIEIAVIDGQRRFGNGFYLPAGPLRESVKRLQKADFIISNGEAATGEYLMRLLPQAIYNLLCPDLSLNAENVTKPIHAVAAIGNPQRFFGLLRQLGFVVIEHIFPDHYIYKKQDFNFDAEVIIMTEKDAIKCRIFADQRFWCLPVAVEMDEKFPANLLTSLNKVASEQNNVYHL